MPEEALPETLLVVLDQNMFNTNWRQSSPTAPQDYGELEMDFFDTLLRTGLDYGNRKFSIAKTILPQQGVYGLAAPPPAAWALPVRRQLSLRQDG